MQGSLVRFEEMFGFIRWKQHKVNFYASKFHANQPARLPRWYARNIQLKTVLLGEINPHRTNGNERFPATINDAEPFVEYPPSLFRTSIVLICGILHML